MPTRHAAAVWTGSIKEGSGRIRLGSGAFEGSYTFKSRFEKGEPARTNPEELIGAAHAGCFAMALAKALGDAGHDPHRVEASADVHLDSKDGSPCIGRIDLKVIAEASGLDDTAFQTIAEKAKDACPVSKVLAGAEIRLDAALRQMDSRQ